MSQITLAEQATPSTPASGSAAIYPKSDGQIYSIDDTGAERPLALQWAVVSDTYDTATASGNQAITGAGFAPSAVLAVQALTANGNMGSVGFSANGASSANLYSRTGTSAGTFGVTNALMTGFSSAGNVASGSVGSWDSDGITIAWTKTGSPTGSITQYFLFLR